MIRQERLVVFGDKPQITAVFPCHSKLEITRMEPHQHRRRPDRIGNGHARGRGIQGNLFPVRPRVVPPVGSVGGLREKQETERGEQPAPAKYYF